jgi:hypothetical protein
MPRPKNTIPTVSVAFQAMPFVLEYLDQLVQKQVFGSTRAEVVRRLIEQQIREMIKDGDVEEMRPRTAKKPHRKKG